MVLSGLDLSGFSNTFAYKVYTFSKEKKKKKLLTGIFHQAFVYHPFVFLLFAGNFEAFMQKEIFEQPESVVNTMRGRICFDTNTGDKKYSF